MASHHPHHHHCHPGAATATSTCHYHCCYTDYNPCHHYPPPPTPPPPPPPDPHLHHPHLYSSHRNRPYASHIQPHYFQESYFLEEEKSLPTMASLLRRIAFLEASLLRRSSSSFLSSSQSLRDAAARTIQTHFRAFLVRRSRTLRQLKNLASIKSTLNVLKSSVSENAGLDYDALYQKATCLLLKLDCIRGDDPMIRDGKRSISRELLKYLDLIDGFCGKRREVASVVKNVRYRRSSTKSRILQCDGEMGNVYSGVVGSVNVEKLRGLVEKIDKLSTKVDTEERKLTENPRISTVRKHGITQNRSGSLLKQRGEIHTKAKKSVSFAEDGKVYLALRRIQDSVPVGDCDGYIDGDISVNVEREIEDYPDREVEEVGVTSKDAEDDEEEDLLENGDSQCSSDGEEESKRYMRSKPCLDIKARLS